MFRRIFPSSAGRRTVLIIEIKVQITTAPQHPVYYLAMSTNCCAPPEPQPCINHSYTYSHADVSRSAVSFIATCLGNHQPTRRDSTFDFDFELEAGAHHQPRETCHLYQRLSVIVQCFIFLSPTCTDSNLLTRHDPGHAHPDTYIHQFTPIFLKCISFPHLGNKYQGHMKSSNIFPES